MFNLVKTTYISVHDIRSAPFELLGVVVLKLKLRSAVEQIMDQQR